MDRQGRPGYHLFYIHLFSIKIVTFTSYEIVIQSLSCLTLCNPMDRNTPGFPVLPYLLELAQTHAQWVDDAIQPSQRLSPSSQPAAAASLQSCPTLSDPMDCSLPGSSVHGIFQARLLEWDATAFSVSTCWPCPNARNSWLATMTTKFWLCGTTDFGSVDLISP